MHDNWEIAVFGNTNVADQASDFDLDGMLDVDEYISWTDAADESDLLSVTGIRLTPSGLQVQFPTVEGLSYTVESLTAPDSASGSVEAIVPGTGGPTWSPSISGLAPGAAYLRIRTDR